MLLLCDSSRAIFFPEWKLKRNYLPFTRVNVVNSVISNHSSITKNKLCFIELQFLNAWTLHLFHNTVNPLASLEIFDFWYCGQRIRSLISVVVRELLCGIIKFLENTGLLHRFCYNWNDDPFDTLKIWNYDLFIFFTAGISTIIAEFKT